MKSVIATISLELDILNDQLQKFGKTECKYHKNRLLKPRGLMECRHSSMGQGGLTRNTDCELTNCPLIGK